MAVYLSALIDYMDCLCGILSIGISGFYGKFYPLTCIGFINIFGLDK